MVSSVALLISSRPNILEWILYPNFMIPLKLLTLESVFLGKIHFGPGVSLGSKIPWRGTKKASKVYWIADFPWNNNLVINVSIIYKHIFTFISKNTHLVFSIFRKQETRVLQKMQLNFNTNINIWKVHIS